MYLLEKYGQSLNNLSKFVSFDKANKLWQIIWQSTYTLTKYMNIDKVFDKAHELWQIMI